MRGMVPDAVTESRCPMTSDQQTTNASIAQNDRVRIRAAIAEGLVHPLRGWAQKGRKGTVIALLRHDPGKVNVRFDYHGKGKPRHPTDYCYVLDENDLEILAKGETASEASTAS
jgi:hypothetical protein